MMMIFKAEGFVHTDKPAYYVSENTFILDNDLSSLKFEFFGGGKELFFHIKDPAGVLRVQHQSSSEPSTVFLHEDEKKSGTGTCFGEIRKGEWSLKVFTYAPRFNRMWGEVPFTVKIFGGLDDSDIHSADCVSWVDSGEMKKGRIILKEFEIDNPESIDEKWLSGDFHVHSSLSDGTASPSELLDEGIKKNIDFFFISEHNTLTTGFAEKEGIVVFPSYEATTAIGHFNAPGIRYMPEWILSKGPVPSWEDLKTLIKDFRDNGILISINHPFSEPWHWQYNDMPLSWINAIEIITNPYYRNLGNANEKAFLLIDLLWNNGYRITGIGGSDTHTAISDSQLGQPVTKVFAKHGSLSSILDGVKKHKVEIFVDFECDFNYISEGNVLLPGTDVKNSDDLDLEFSLTLKDSSEIFNLRVIENGNLVEERKAYPGEIIRIQRVWKGKSDWIRCEMRDKDNRIRGYINPIHRGHKAGGVEKWGDVLDML